MRTFFIRSFSQFTGNVDLEQDNGKSFNCAESVLIRVNRENPLPDYESCCMKIASVLGGGVAGTGEICGAVSGAVVCIALLFGTDGTEPLDDFKSKRSQAREVVKILLKDFTDDWGSVQCRNLLAMDKGMAPQIGTRRSNQSSRTLCEEYVDWAVKKTEEIRNDNNI